MGMEARVEWKLVALSVDCSGFFPSNHFAGFPTPPTGCFDFTPSLVIRTARINVIVILAHPRASRLLNSASAFHQTPSRPDLAKPVLIKQKSKISLTCTTATFTTSSHISLHILKSFVCFSFFFYTSPVCCFSMLLVPRNFISLRLLYRFASLSWPSCHVLDNDDPVLGTL